MRICHTRSLNSHVVGRFFRGAEAFENVSTNGLNPHVVGRFFRAVLTGQATEIPESLNPHVVGRFFRVFQQTK